MAHVLDGLEEQVALKTPIAKGVATLTQTFKTPPKLAIVLVANHPPSLLYVEKKQAFAKAVGIETTLIHLQSPSTQECIEVITRLNEDPKIHGILLQLPVPGSVDKDAIIHTIDPEKDVDGLHPLNTGLLAQNQESLSPCTPQGCMHLVRLWKKDLTGLTAVIVGRSNLVGKPLANLLNQANATVIQAHSKTENLKDMTQLADILVVATGQANLIDATFVKEGACIIDVGISKDSKGDTVGDVNFKSTQYRADAITPVPGGVGPMTVTYLMINVLKAFCQQKDFAFNRLNIF